MFYGAETDQTSATTPAAFVPTAQYWPQTDRIEVTLNPRRPDKSHRVSDEIQVHVVRGILGRIRLVGFTIFDMGGIQRKSIRQSGSPLRGDVDISTVLRVLHKMELSRKEKIFGKYLRSVERALEHRIKVYL